jgi:hypothetical protein
MNCECVLYGAVELDRDSINKRIKESKKFAKQLQLLASSDEGYGSKLLKCAECGQLWQQSSAWNFGAKEYVFKVPACSVDEWTSEPFAQPDELMICSVTNEQLLSQTFEERDCLCRHENCDRHAIRWNIFCKEHYLSPLIQVPKGRLFPPYTIEASY